MMGRPSIFSDAIADRICAGLSDARSLRSICLDDDMPCQTTVFKWLRENDDFAQQYARAREAQADAIFDEIIDIADDGSNDWTKRHGEEGMTDDVLNHEHVQRSKLRIDARKWMAGKLVPKKYGDKIQHTGDGGGPMLVDWAARAQQARITDEEE